MSLTTFMFYIFSNSDVKRPKKYLRNQYTELEKTGDLLYTMLGSLHGRVEAVDNFNYIKFNAIGYTTMYPKTFSQIVFSSMILLLND